MINIMHEHLVMKNEKAPSQSVCAEPKLAPKSNRLAYAIRYEAENKPRPVHNTPGNVVQCYNSATFFAANKIAATRANHPFSTTTKNLFIGTTGDGTGNDICHSISFSTIDESISAPIRNYSAVVPDNEIDPTGPIATKTEVVRSLEGIRDAVFSNPPPPPLPPATSPSYGSHLTNYKAATKNIMLIENNLPAVRTLPALANRQPIVDAANKLLDALNNSPGNLRAGKSDWNHSVGESFDPRSWFCMKKAVGGALPVYHSSNDNNPASHPLIGTANKEGFYIDDDADCKMIDLILNDTVGYKETFTVDTLKHPTTFEAMMASSSNATGFVARGGGTRLKAYYKPPGAAAWTQFT